MYSFKVNIERLNLKRIVSISRKSAILSLVFAVFLSNVTLFIRPASAADTPTDTSVVFAAPVNPSQLTTWVDDDWTSLPAGSDLGGGLTFGINAFARIQDALNASMAGATVTVFPGFYPESLSITRQVTLVGPNAGIRGASSIRNQEAILTTPATDPLNIAGKGIVIGVAANNVTIDGFTIDGDNPRLNLGLPMNEANSDAAYAIANYAQQAINASLINSLVVQNNVIKNFYIDGLYLADINQASSNNYIRNNKFDNVEPPAYGAGIYIGDNFYAEISNNQMTRTRRCIQTGSYTKANPGTTALITNNTLDCLLTGIWHNLQAKQASVFTISRNTISVTRSSNITNPGVGIWITNMADATDVVLSNNNITNGDFGYQVWNVQNPRGITISGGRVSNSSVGVQLANYSRFGYASYPSTVNLNGVLISNPSNAGIHVYDAIFNPTPQNLTLNIQGTTQLRGGDKGVILEGERANINLNNLAFVGIDNDYIRLVSHSAPVDALSVTFNGKIGNSMNSIDKIATNNKITDQLDKSSLGLVTYYNITDTIPPTVTFNRINNVNAFGADVNVFNDPNYYQNGTAVIGGNVQICADVYDNDVLANLYAYLPSGYFSDGDFSPLPVNNGTFQPVPQGNYCLNWDTKSGTGFKSVADGLYTLTFNARDNNLGDQNNTYAPIQLLVDNTSPSLAFDSTVPADQSSVSGMVDIAFSAGDANGLLTTYVIFGTSTNKFCLNASLQGGLQTCRIDTKLLLDGMQTLSVYAKDKAGNNTILTRSLYVDNTPPSVPTNLKLQNPDLACGSSTNSNNLLAKWDISVDSSSLPVSGYEYQFETPSPSDATQTIITTTFVSVSKNNLRFDQGDGNYRFRVRAKDLSGNFSDYSDWCSVRYDTTPPSAPYFWLEEDSSQVKVEWRSVGDAVSYKIYRANATVLPLSYVLVGTVGNTGYSYIATQDPNTSYYYKMTAIDALGNETALGGVKELYAGTRDIVIDDNAKTADFNASGTVSYDPLSWNKLDMSNNASVAQFMIGGDFFRSNQVTNNETFTWATNAALNGRYSVYVDYACASNRGVVSYSVYSGNDLKDTKTVDQRYVDGQLCGSAIPNYTESRWVYLGTYDLASNGKVVLNTGFGNKYVAADAVAFRRVGDIGVSALPITLPLDSIPTVAVNPIKVGSDF